MHIFKKGVYFEQALNISIIKVNKLIDEKRCKIKTADNDEKNFDIFAKIFFFSIEFLHVVLLNHTVNVQIFVIGFGDFAVTLNQSPSMIFADCSQWMLFGKFV